MKKSAILYEKICDLMIIAHIISTDSHVSVVEVYSNDGKFHRSSPTNFVHHSILMPQ